MNVKTILIPLDGSRLAELALAPAVELARDRGAKLVLLRAAEAHTTVADPTEAQVTVVREAEEYLTALRARMLAGGAAEVETSVWYGPPAGAIVEAATTQKVDLIVMSTHGRSGLGRLILGSVAETVLRGTTIPILVVRNEGAPVDVVSGARPAKETTHV